MLVRLTRGAVTLRAFRHDEFDAVSEALAKLPRDVSPEGPPDPDRLRARLLGSGHLVEGRIDLAVEADRRLVGQIQARIPAEREVPAGVLTLGIVIYDPADRARGIGRPALDLLIDWLFERSGTQSLQALTTLSNEPMRHLLRALGFEERERIDIFSAEGSLFELSRTAWQSLRDPGEDR